MEAPRRLRLPLALLAGALVLLAAIALPAPARAVTIGPGVVFRPSGSWGNLTFQSTQTFSNIQVDATGVRFDSVRFGFQKLPAGFPGLNLTVTTWAPWQTAANTTSIAFTGAAPTGALTYFNLSNLVPLWEYDFYVDSNLQGVQFSTVLGNVSFEWSLWSAHTFRISLGGRSAGSGPLSGSFTYVPPVPGVGRAVYFAAVASGGQPPYTFSWAFGDGNTSFGSAASHSYASARAYVVGLSVTDASRQLVNLVRTLDVTGPPPSQGLTSDFTFAPSSPRADEPVSFSAVAGYGTPSYNFTWAFGDGFGAFGNPTTHAYAQPGLYNVTLNVTDSGGQRVGVVHGLLVAPGPPGVTFENITAAFSYAIQDATVSFTDDSRSSAGFPIILRIWVFGDGSRSEDPAPQHTYSMGFLSATYRAILVVCDAANNCGSTYRDITFVNWVVILLLVLIGVSAVVAAVFVRRQRRKQAPKARGKETEQDEGEDPDVPSERSVAGRKGRG